MAKVDVRELISVQSNTVCIRNICILAHVDHGKTTLSDSLISSNGIISAKLAGKLRFLDSTEEEQQRGITMHSSAISLLYSLTPNIETSNQEKENYLINLVDSPGHIDFSSDVSTATRLCDGALIVVDVLEGLCTQTHAVVYKALKERMRPCLVLNKLDRLAVEVKLSTTEAFNLLRRLIENMNALAFSLVNSELIKRSEEYNLLPSELEKEESKLLDWWTFSPDKGNVVFTGALDSWGFGIMKFINYYSKKLNLNKGIIKKYIFEDYTFHFDTKKISKCDVNEYDVPMFAQLVLDPIWNFYKLTMELNNPEAAAKLAKEEFQIEILPREINKRDPRSTLQSILRRWLPLSDAVLRMVVKIMPNPIEAQDERIFTLLPRDAMVQPQSSSHNGSMKLDVVRNHLSHIHRSMSTCSIESNAPLVIFISKMIPIRFAELSPKDSQLIRRRSDHKFNNEVDQASVLTSDTEVFVALARVYSGVLRRNQPLYVIGHRHDPLLVADEIGDGNLFGDVPALISSTATRVVAPETEANVGLYIMLGPSVYPVDEVPAGNIVGIVGLAGSVFKTATVSDTWACFPMKAITFQAKPMLKVAIEPKISHLDLPKIEKGLQSLYQFDPVVEIGIEENGQHTIMCLGELHLEQCVKALTDRFAKCEIKVSEPLISFRETIITSGQNVSLQVPILPPPWCDFVNTSMMNSGGGNNQLNSNIGIFRMIASSQNLSISFRCFSIPSDIVQSLEKEIHATFLTASSDEVSLSTSPHEPILSEIQSNQSTNEALNPFIKKAYEILLKCLKANVDLEESIDECFQISSSSTHQEGIQSGTALKTLPIDPDFGTRLLSVGPRKVHSNVLMVSGSIEISIWSGNIPSTANPTTSQNGGLKGNKLRLQDNIHLKDGHDDVDNESNGTGSHVIGCIPYDKHEDSAFQKVFERLSNSITAGFQETVSCGPLMNESLHGVGFVIEKIELNHEVCLSILQDECHRNQIVWSDGGGGMKPDSEIISDHDVVISINSSMKNDKIQTGKLISEVRTALSVCMLRCPLRIVEPIYCCDIQCDQAQIGNFYGVLSKRRGHVIKEDIIEGTSLYLLSAELPVASSFGFTQELLEKTSGNGTAPQLSFSHWQINDLDPFWKPRSDEELEEYGETLQGTEKLFTRMLIDKVRKRKGLPIEEKIVAYAEKQRTLNKKK